MGVKLDEDRAYIVTVPEIPGCYTQAKTPNQLRGRIKEAMECCGIKDSGNLIIQEHNKTHHD